MSKMCFCNQCLFNEHETSACKAQQLKWAWENLMKDFFEQPVWKFSTCKHFEPLEYGGKP